MKKLMLAVASLAVIAAPVAASAQSWGHERDNGGWSHRGDYGRGYRGDRGNGGAALAAGVFGLVLGSALASSNHSYGYAQPYGYSPSYGYNRSYGYSRNYGYGRGYGQGYGYAQRCEWRNQAYDTGYGDIEYRQIEVCR